MLTLVYNQSVVQTFTLPGSKVSTTPLRQLGFQQCLPYSWTTLRGKHCRHPITVLMGVVDTFEDGLVFHLTGVILSSFLLFFRYESEVYETTFPYLTYPMAGLSMTGSTYLCMAISIERYLGICHRNIKMHR